MSQAYHGAVKNAAELPVDFWGSIAQQVHWFRPFNKVLDDSQAPFYHWFPGGLFNTCYNALDIHIEQGRGNKVAVIYDSPVAGIQRHITYSQLRDEVAVFAGALQSRGVGKGDCVLIYLPMVPEAFVAMLACARIGAIHSVVFGGFAAPELCNRINAATPKCLITASCGLLTADHVMPYKPIVDDAIEQANHKPEFCVVLQQPQVHAWLTLRDVEWNDFVANAQPVPCVPLESTDNLYVLYTSGTTGDTKGIARDNAGHCVALKWTMDAIYGVEDDDVFWASSDIGWVVGHSYIIYAPLFRGITTVMYDGKPTGTPDSGAFWRVMAEHKVNIVLAAPNSFRAIRREDPNARRMRMYDLSQLKAVYLAGEHTDLGTLRWLQAILQRKLGHQRPLVFDHYWQTETGWAIAGPCPGLCGGYSNMTVKFGSCHRLVPGFQVQEMDEDCKTPHPNPSKVGDQTYPLAIRLPLPPGCLTTLHKNDELFLNTYITPDGKWYKTGDAGYLDEDGFVYVLTRTDDLIKVAGHQLATAAIEEIVASHPAVAECAVFGIPDSLKGQVPVGCIVLKDGAQTQEVSENVCALVRQRVGPVASFTRCEVVPRLPTTRSGKILRKELSLIASGRPYAVPPTIDDFALLLLLEGILRPQQPARL